MAELPPTEEGARTDVAGDGPTERTPAHRTPDQSTAGLASSSHPTGAPARGEGDVAALDIGETLAGRFTILRFIARGGMGAVYEATDVLLRTRVALKLISSHLATDATAVERFRREVLLARRVSHPNVCRVYELYEARTSRGHAIHFITMELLEGESLARRLAGDGRMKTDEALPLVKQMCEGLAAAHTEGVIHRDFKSSNVLLVPRATTDGERGAASTRVVITDFGVARAIHVASEVEAGEGPLTGQGILGTPEYMAPEQVTGGEVTAATDVYALGVVLYEMVTGKLPFVADTPLAAAARRLNEAPPRPEATVPGLDKRWAATIVRCLARQPERRFRSARDVIPALDGPTKVSRLAVPAAAILLLMGVYGVARYLPSLRLGAPERPSAFVVPRQKVAILGFRNEIQSPKLSWLPTAVTELLAYEVAAAESSLRIAGPGQVDLERRSLGVSLDDLGQEKTQARLQTLVDADVLVHGSVSPVSTGDVHLHIQALDARSRKELGSLDEDLGSGAARLADALPALGTRIRNLLNVSLTAEEEGALSTSRAHNLDAAKLHSDGVTRSRLWDVDEARSHFEAAVAADPSFVLPHRGIIETWSVQSNRKKFLEASKRLRALPGALTARQAAIVDASLAWEQDEAKATEAWKALFETSPDDFQIGMALFARSPLRAKLAVLKRMQQLRAGPPLMLELREAAVAGMIRDPQTDERLSQLAARAKELGARRELARARMLQAQRVPIEDTERLKEAMTHFEEAERLSTVLGEFDTVAEVKRQKALWVGSTGSRRVTLAAMDDAAGAYRRLGDREQVAHLLLVTADYLRDFGELATARKKLEEARQELETIESQPDGIMFGYYFRVRATLLFDSGDFEAARDALRRSRRSATMPGWSGWVELLEASLLNEEDHREEARAAYAKATAEARVTTDAFIRFAGACAVDCDGDQPAAGLQCLAKTCQADQPDLKGVRKANCQVEEAYCRFRANDFTGADQVARRAATFLASKDYYELALRTRAVLMRVAATRGESPKAIRVLRADLAKIESEENRRLAFETALALGDVELKGGHPEGRTRLSKLEQDAKSREFFRIARLAREVLDQKPMAAATPQR